MQHIADPYRALGVARSATDVEIKSAHRKLVKRYHPDTGSQSDTERFLRVQEAYRVLSDPLLRKEWDLKHAPGPIRADRPTAAPGRTRRPPTAKPEAAEPAQTTAPPREHAHREDVRTRPRSSRAYTWSASEVPWWEDSGRSEKRPPRRRHAPPQQQQQSETAGPPRSEETAFTQQDFDVYNRSSGAAWSSAARAYFRKGEAELPRRGSFQYQGTQVVTAGRARSAAEAEARRRAAAAAAASMDDVYARPQPVSPMPGPHEGTTHVVRRALAAPWPSVFQRFAFALVAWVPIAGFVAFASNASGDELMGIVLTIGSLALLLALPRIAYICALSTVLALFVGAFFVGGLLFSGRPPGADVLALYVGALLVVGYLVTAVVIAIGPASLRPWAAR